MLNDDLFTEKEAIDIIKSKFPNKEIRKITEYLEIYVFEMVPIGESKSKKIFFDSTYSVNKITGMILNFTPNMIKPYEWKMIDNRKA